MLDAVGEEGLRGFGGVCAGEEGLGNVLVWSWGCHGGFDGCGGVLLVVRLRLKVKLEIRTVISISLSLPYLSPNYMTCATMEGIISICAED